MELPGKGLIQVAPLPGESLDCEAVAALLAEGDQRPLLVFDEATRIRLSNPVMDELMGHGRGALAGRSLRETCMQQGKRLDGSLWDGVLRGSIHTLGCEVVTAGGQLLRLVLELSRVGQGGSQAVLAVVTSVTRVETAQTFPPGVSCLYEIRCQVQDFGTIRAAYVQGSRVHELEGQRCYAVLHHRSAPCEGCPALLNSHQDWPRTAVLRCPRQANAFHVVTAEPLDSHHVRLSAHPIPDDVFRQLVRAKVGDLASAAGLSERERLVLDQLVAGNELREIAEILKISVRTVKFHQANILRKLEVDSRAALMRLIV
jgi:DNA-binding CsgD family transcriptional regulator